MSNLIRPLRAVAKGGAGDINLLAARAADEIEQFEARMRELIALMEGDMAFGSITAGDTRKKILAQARELVPDMPPAKTIKEILALNA
jgi:hypothetical protein